MIIYKMNIKNKNTFSIKKLVIPVVVFSVVAGGAYAYAVSNNFFQEPEDISPSSQFESQNDPIPGRLVPTDNTNKGGLGETNSQNEGIAVSITAANVNGTVLQVRGLIGSVVDEGSCVLEVSGGPETKELTASVQPGPSSSTCQGFDIATSDLGSGSRTLTLKYVRGDTSAQSEPREIQL